MAHRESDRLWELAQGTLGEAEAQQLRLHLADCEECAAAFERVIEAQEILVPPEPPPLSDARWRAIDAKVLEAAAREMARPSLAGWLRELFTPAWRPALGLASAALVLVAVLASRAPVQPSNPVATAPVVPQPAPTANLPEPVAPPKPAPTAAVLAARKASRQSEPLAEQMAIAKGAELATEKGGELWMALPDGSRAGLLEGSQAVLAEVSPEHVRIELGQGAVAVAAVHAELRRFEVASGEVVVRVVGTRFLVQRRGEATEVEVQEGKVEVERAGERRYVEGGHGIKVGKAGTFEEKLEPHKRKELAKVVPLRPVAPPAEPTEAPAPAPSVEEKAQETPEPSNADEWASMPEAPDASAEQQAAAAPAIAEAKASDAGTADAGKMGPVDRTRAWLSKQAEKLKPLSDERVEQAEIHELEINEKIGLCERALERADRWLTNDLKGTGYHGKHRDEHRRRVLIVRARCLENMGRIEEAKATREQIK